MSQVLAILQWDPRHSMWMLSVCPQETNWFFNCRYVAVEKRSPQVVVQGVVARHAGKNESNNALAAIAVDYSK